MKPLVIVGAGGHAREVVDVVEAINADHPQYELLGFIVDAPYGKPGDLVDEWPILGDFTWLDQAPAGVAIFCGVGYSDMRYHLVQRLRPYSPDFCSVIHPAAILARRVTVGMGVLITAGCVVSNHVHVADHVHINRVATVGHDATLGDYASLGPGVNVAGNVEIGEGAFIGTGASIVERMKIGAWSMVGAGSTVVDAIPANSTAVGVPARVIKTHPPGWHNLDNADGI